MDFEHYDGRKKGKDGGHLYCIYKLSFQDMVYIGQTNSTQKRFTRHMNDSGCAYLCNAIKKHGWVNFTKEVLEKDLIKEEANIAEDKFIKEHDCIAPGGYNLRTGGESYEVSEVTKKIFSGNTKKQWEDENFRILRKEAAKKQWADPEYRENAIAIRRKITEEEFAETFAKFKGDKLYISEALGLCDSSFYRYMDRCGIPLDEISRRPVNYIRKITDDEVFLEANERLGGNIPLLAEEFNVTITTIKEHRKRLGLSRPYTRKNRV